MSLNTETITPCKVVVIDDKESEVSGLLRALSAKDIPILYYKGRKEELPSTPLTGIRIIFLDMKLEGMDGQTPITIASSLMNLLKKIVSADNGPFLIFAWTKENDILEAFTEQLNRIGKDVPNPVHMINMDKVECMIDDEIDYLTVARKLDMKLNELSIFKFFMSWEKIVRNARSEVVGLISSMVEAVEVAAWRDEANKILYKFAEAQSGVVIKKNSLSPTHSTMYVLNSILKDCIEKKVSVLTQEYLTTPQETEFSDEIKGQINTKINIRDLKEVEVKATPGNIYILNNYKELFQYANFLPKRYYDFQRDFLKLNINRIDEHDDILTLLRSCRPCLLEITPLCDYTYDRWKNARVLVGIMVPRGLINRLKDKAKSVFNSPLLFVNNDLHYFIFNFYNIIMTDFKILNKLEPNYQIRVDLLSDIQKQYSNHISRGGIFFLR